MNMQEYINNHVNEDQCMLELYYDDYENYTNYESLVIPPPVKLFISDIDCNKYVLSDTLNVFDIYPTIDNLSIIFNIPKNLEHISLQNKNILNKELMELFNPNFEYRYLGCMLDGIELNILVNQRYKKYFVSEPRYATNRLSNQKLMNNMIYSKVHRQITNDIYEYESRLTQAKDFMKQIKDELLMYVYHPDRVEIMLHKYGNDFINCL